MGNISSPPNILWPRPGNCHESCLALRLARFAPVAPLRSGRRAGHLGVLAAGGSNNRYAFQSIILHSTLAFGLQSVPIIE